MYIDIFVCAFILLMLIRGIVTGVFRYLYLLLAMICALFIAHNTAPQVAIFINDAIGLSLSTAYTASALAIWTVATFILRLCFSWLLNPILSHFLSGPNKVFGAVAGFINGLLLSYLMLWGLVNINNHFPNWDLIEKIAPQDSITFNLVRENNYLNNLNIDLIPRIQQLTEIAQDPEQLAPDLMENQNFKQVINNSDLLQKIKQGNIHSLLGESSIRELLLDPQIIQQLNNRQAQESEQVQK